MQVFKRISLFILTNVLIMVTIGVAWSVVSHFFGFDQMSSAIPGLMALCLVMGMVGSFVSLFISKWMAKRMYGVQIINPEDRSLSAEMRWLVDTVHGLAKRARLPKMPEVGIYDSPDVNAFATGPSKSNSLVAVSSGLLQKMARNEVEGVLGHEVSHIANGDMVTMTLIQGIVNSIAMFFSRILANVIASNVDEKIRGIVHFAVVILGDILFTLLGSVVVAYVSRRREFRADHGGALLATKASMISALRKLQTVHGQPIDEAGDNRDALAALKISHRQRGGLMAFLMTHPPLEERIAALERSTIRI